MVFLRGGVSECARLMSQPAVSVALFAAVAAFFSCGGAPQSTPAAPVHAPWGPLAVAAAAGGAQLPRAGNARAGGAWNTLGFTRRQVGGSGEPRAGGLQAAPGLL